MSLGGGISIGRDRLPYLSTIRLRRRGTCEQCNTEKRNENPGDTGRFLLNGVTSRSGFGFPSISAANKGESMKIDRG